jgi:hypothetical protein
MVTGWGHGSEGRCYRCTRGVTCMYSSLQNYSATAPSVPSRKLAAEGVILEPPHLKYIEDFLHSFNHRSLRSILIQSWSSVAPSRQKQCLEPFDSLLVSGQTTNQACLSKASSGLD